MTSDRIKKRFTHQFVLVSILIIIFLLLYTMRHFVDAFLGAIIMYVLFRPMMRRLTEKRHWKKPLAALLIMGISFVAVLIPILIMSFMIIPKMTIFFKEGSVTMKVLNAADEQVKNLTGYEFLTPATIEELRAEAGSFITGFLGETAIIITDIGLLYFLLFYLLINVNRIESLFERYLPISNDRLANFAKELEMQTYSNSLGAPLLALIQGFFAAFGYWIFGLPEPLFWGIMTGFFSFIPIVGSTLIWFPAAIFQLSSGMIWQGAAIFIYGFLVISMVDNVFRFIFQKKFADVHPLITIIGVIMGLQIFGVPGIIFGPLLISYLLILLRIFKEEFLDA